MPENLKIGAFVFGSILVLIAILGGNFKLFGAEVAASVSNRFLRFVAFALGATLLVVAMHSPDPSPRLGASNLPSPTPTQPLSNSPSSGPALIRSPTPSPSPSSSPSPSPSLSSSSSACLITIRNTLVPLMNEPDKFSREIANVRPGEYASLAHKITNRGSGLGEEGWFQIEVEGRKGWIADDTSTVDRKSPICP